MTTIDTLIDRNKHFAKRGMQTMAALRMLFPCSHVRV